MQNSSSLSCGYRQTFMKKKSINKQDSFFNGKNSFQQKINSFSKTFYHVLIEAIAAKKKSLVQHEVETLPQNGVRSLLREWHDKLLQYAVKSKSNKCVYRMLTMNRLWLRVLGWTRGQSLRWQQQHLGTKQQHPGLIQRCKHFTFGKSLGYPCRPTYQNVCYRYSYVFWVFIDVVGQMLWGFKNMSKLFEVIAI